MPEEKITRIGNIMLDSFERTRAASAAAREPEAIGVAGERYCVATLHRPANVDERRSLGRLADCLLAVHRLLPIVFPVHPRTAARLAEFGLAARLEEAGVRLIAPLPYIRFMSLVAGAAAVVTDSGGLQEETTYLGIPCFTLRENTERPITITQGTNRLATPVTLPDLLATALARTGARLPRPEFWDGNTAMRCLSDLRARSGSVERVPRRAAA